MPFVDMSKATSRAMYQSVDAKSVGIRVYAKKPGASHRSPMLDVRIGKYWAKELRLQDGDRATVDWDAESSLLRLRRITTGGWKVLRGKSGGCAVRTTVPQGVDFPMGDLSYVVPVDSIRLTEEGLVFEMKTQPRSAI